jgi:outer membrane biosynthesis protein TonB
MRRRRQARAGRAGRAVAASVVLHVGVALSLTLADGAEPPPRERIYAVDIVSPPANVAGERPTEALAAQETAPEPAPEPPAAAPPEPEPVPEPTPAPPPRPEPAPRREPPKEQPKAREPPKEQPKAREAPKEQPKAREAPPRTTPTTGTGTNRQPATGRDPQPSSPGGEGIRVRTPGDPCPVAGYCENVAVTVQRFFRPPAGSAGAVGEVCFRVLRDGAAADMRIASLRGGGPAFRLAMLEAVEAAGQRRAFGPLPRAFDPAVPWCVELSPS